MKTDLPANFVCIQCRLAYHSRCSKGKCKCPDLSHWSGGKHV